VTGITAGLVNTNRLESTMNKMAPASARRNDGEGADTMSDETGFRLSERQFIGDIISLVTEGREGLDAACVAFTYLGAADEAYVDEGELRDQVTRGVTVAAGALDLIRVKLALLAAARGGAEGP